MSRRQLKFDECRDCARRRSPACVRCDMGELFEPRDVTDPDAAELRQIQKDLSDE